MEVDRLNFTPPSGLRFLCLFNSEIKNGAHWGTGNLECREALRIKPVFFANLNSRCTNHAESLHNDACFIVITTTVEELEEELRRRRREKKRKQKMTKIAFCLLASLLPW